MKLGGKTAVVTGSTRGIGLAIARAFVPRGGARGRQRTFLLSQELGRGMLERRSGAIIKATSRMMAIEWAVASFISDAVLTADGGWSA